MRVRVAKTNKYGNYVVVFMNEQGHVMVKTFVMRESAEAFKFIIDKVEDTDWMTRKEDIDEVLKEYGLVVERDFEDESVESEINLK